MNKWCAPAASTLLISSRRAPNYPKVFVSLCAPIGFHSLSPDARFQYFRLSESEHSSQKMRQGPIHQLSILLPQGNEAAP